MRMDRTLSICFAMLMFIAGISGISWGCSHQAPQIEDRRTLSTVIRDASITSPVKLSLAFERGVKATDINVDTDRGTVTLNGEVGSEAERQLAAKVSEDVSGVRKVVNRIQVRG